MLLRAFARKFRGRKRITAIRKELVDFFKFIKPYQGRWHKGTKISPKAKDIIHYQEREWRYAPLLDEYKVLLGDTAFNQELREFFNKELKSKLIQFNLDDIKFVILKRKNETNKFAYMIKGMGYTPEQENELIAKIISLEEIREDF